MGILAPLAVGLLTPNVSKFRFVLLYTSTFFLTRKYSLIVSRQPFMNGGLKDLKWYAIDDFIYCIEFQNRILDGFWDFTRYRRYLLIFRRWRNSILEQSK